MKLKHFLVAALCAAILIPVLILPGCGKNNEPAVWVKLEKYSTSITVGKSERLEYTVDPSTTTVTSTLWMSSDTSVATVSASGLVTGVKAGMAVVTLTVNGNASASCNVTIEPLKNGMEDFGDGGDASEQFN